MHKFMKGGWTCIGCLLAALVSPAVIVAADALERGIAEFPKLSAESDWPWWRGPSRNGIAAKTETVPTKWSDSKGVVWKTPVPGRGHSSPTIVGNLIFLATADGSQQVQSVLAFNRRTGQPVWNTEISRGGFPAKNHPKNTEATTTIASDGERLFVTFFHHKTIQATALDLAGKKLWQQTAGAFNPKRFEYGYAPSPLIYRGTVIIAAEYDGDSFLAALERTSGKPVWRTPRPQGITFSTPVVGHVAGRDQLLISGAEQVTSYDPNTGKQLWTTPGTASATCGTMIWDGDVVFASGGFPQADTLAVRADGSGEVLWRNGQKCYEQSMLTHAGYVYAFTGSGVMFCWRAADGEKMWEQRLKGPVSASPVLAGGHIYWANELGKTYVFRPNPDKFDLVAENQLGDEAFASPAICGGQVFIRTATGTGSKRQEFLYCLGG